MRLILRESLCGILLGGHWHYLKWQNLVLSLQCISEGCTDEPRKLLSNGEKQFFSLWALKMC